MISLKFKCDILYFMGTGESGTPGPAVLTSSMLRSSVWPASWSLPEGSSCSDPGEGLGAWGPEGKRKPSDRGTPIPALGSLWEEVKLGMEGHPVTLNSGSQNGPGSPGLRTTWVSKTLDSQRHPHLPDPRFWGQGPASAGTSLSYTLKLTNPTLLD